ncbi:MAG TPA: single-stranded DNA-binding protein [Chloroflexota bacterium]|nr:single-stranded DNA-binding protein [Chloroflexota bacterium]
MGSTLNSVTLIGHLGIDPEMRYTGEGIARVRLRLATDRPVRAGAEPETDWHSVVCWGQVAEFANEYLRTGRLVYVAGRLAYYTVAGQDGTQHRVTRIVANEVMPLDRRPCEDDEDGNDENDAAVSRSAPR